MEINFNPHGFHMHLRATTGTIGVIRAPLLLHLTLMVTLRAHTMIMDTVIGTLSKMA